MKKKIALPLLPLTISILLILKALNLIALSWLEVVLIPFGIFLATILIVFILALLYFTIIELGKKRI